MIICDGLNECEDRSGCRKAERCLYLEREGLTDTPASEQTAPRVSDARVFELYAGAELCDATSEASNVLRDLRDARATIKALAAENTQLKTDNDYLTEQLEAISREAEALAAELAEAKAEVERLRELSNGYVATINSVQADARMQVDRATAAEAALKAAREARAYCEDCLRRWDSDRTSEYWERYGSPNDITPTES